jgi:hypothetical protein
VRIKHKGEDLTVSRRFCQFLEELLGQEPRAKRAGQAGQNSHTTHLRIVFRARQDHERFNEFSDVAIWVSPDRRITRIVTLTKLSGLVTDGVRGEVQRLLPLYCKCFGE